MLSLEHDTGACPHLLARPPDELNKLIKRYRKVIMWACVDGMKPRIKDKKVGGPSSESCNVTDPRFHSVWHPHVPPAIPHWPSLSTASPAA